MYNNLTLKVVKSRTLWFYEADIVTMATHAWGKYSKIAAISVTPFSLKESLSSVNLFGITS